MVAGKATLGLLLGAAVGAGAPAAWAQQTDSPLKSAMKLLGFATDAPKPPDFVIQSRPKSDLDYIPVFQAPPEPAKPALNGDELKAVRGDLDSSQKRVDAVRSAYPPAAKAIAEQQAASKKPKANSAAAGQ
jgi:hypothetical protein